MAGKTAGFRERLAADLDYDKLSEMLAAAMKGTHLVHYTCRGCKRSDKVEIPDYRNAILAAQFWAEHGFGKAAMAKAVEDADFTDRDPFSLTANERGVLRDRVEATLGKA